MTLLASNIVACLIWLGVSASDHSLIGNYWSCENGIYTEIEFRELYFISRWGRSEFEGEATYYYRQSHDTLYYSRLPFNISSSDQITQALLKMDDNRLIINSSGHGQSFKKFAKAAKPQVQRKDQNFGVIWYSEEEVGFNQRLQERGCQ